MTNDPCGSHTKGDGSYWKKDARGIPVTRVCDKCEKFKLAKYRPEIFTDSNYDTFGEQVEEDH